MSNLYIFMLVGTTLAVVLSRRTMYGILFLILLFAIMALFVVSLKVDFIGLIFVIVYVGAIATLFLFIIMMLGGEDWVSDPATGLESYQLLLGSGYRANWLLALASKAAWYAKHTLLDIVIAFIMAAAFMSVVSSEFTGNFSSWLDVAAVDYSAQLFNNVYLYGVFFYNTWYIPFLLAAIVLLIAMLGSIVLTTRLLTVDSNASGSSKLAPKSQDQAPAKTEESILDKYAKQQKREESLAALLLPFDIVWTGVCIALAWVCKGVGVMFVPYVVYVMIWVGIYGVGVYLLNNMLKRFKGMR
jgi:NADH-quinone oxidoreductase subunit J